MLTCSALFTAPSFDARAARYDAVMKQVSIQELVSQSRTSVSLPCPASPTSSAAALSSASSPLASRRPRPASSAPLELESSLESAAAPRRGRSLMRTYHRCAAPLAVSRSSRLKLRAGRWRRGRSRCSAHSQARQLSASVCKSYDLLQPQRFCCARYHPSRFLRVTDSRHFAAPHSPA